MALRGKINGRKMLIAAGWLLLSGACITLLAAGVRHKNSLVCNGIEVTIKGARNNFFIGKEDVIDVVKGFAGNRIEGAPVVDFNLVNIENALKKEVWISKAELFFDNNGVLQAEVHEREPLARIFTSSGQSFYIDEFENILPLSEKLSARVPMFTNFPNDGASLSKSDSVLLHDIKSIGAAIQKDSFLMGMIEQVAIGTENHFEMVPKMGDQLIVFGEAKDIDHKFHKLKLFYRKVITGYGWHRYNVINLQYKGQIVAKIKGKEDVQADSLRTLDMMKAIAAYTSRMASDSTQTIVQDNERNSTHESIIIQSFQREESDGNESHGSWEEIMNAADEENKKRAEEAKKKLAEEEKKKNVVTTVPVTATPKPATASVKKDTKPVKPASTKVKPVTKPTVKPKPAEKKPEEKKAEKPKAVMKGNDY